MVFSAAVWRAPGGWHLRLAASVARAYEEVFDDPSLRHRVYSRAKEAGAAEVVDLLAEADRDDDTAGRVN